MGVIHHILVDLRRFNAGVQLHAALRRGNLGRLRQAVEGRGRDGDDQHDNRQTSAF